jgi:hypothetical protein
MDELQPIENTKKTFSIWRFIKRLFFTIIISSISIVGISILLVYVYEDDVKNLIIKELNKHLKTEVHIDPKNIDLTVLRSFPHCAIEFKDFTALDAKEFNSNDTLLYAKRLALAFNIKDLFNKNYTIKDILLEDANCHLKVNKTGNANYLVWKSDSSSVTTNDSLKFALEKITLTHVKLTYKNSKQKIKLNTTIKNLNFKGEFNNSNYLLVSDGKAYVDLFQIDKVKYVTNKNLKLNVELDVSGNSYNIKKAETTFNSTELISSGAFVVNDSLVSLDINFKGNNLDVASTLSLLPEKFQSKITDYSSDGVFYASGEAHYQAGKPFSVRSEFGIKNANILYKPKGTTLSNVNLIGSLVINEHHSELKLQNISANLNSNSFSGNVELTNFENPYIKLNVAAKTKLEELISFYPIDTLESVSGNIDVTANIEGLVSELQSNTYSPTIKANGEATITNIKAKFKQSEKELNIPEGKVSLNERHLNIFGLKLIKGNSDVMLIGEMPNFLGYLFDTKTPLSIIANITSNNIQLEDFIFASKSGGSSEGISIPDNFDFNINVNINNFTFGKFMADNIKGSVLLKNQKIALKDVTLNATDGTIKLNAFADASSENIKISGDCELQKLNIQKLFTQLNNFGQTTLQDKHLHGYITANVDFTGTWNKKLEVDLNSINATSSILIERGELIGFKPLESLAKYIDVNELKLIKFSMLQSAIEIKNKVIIIPRTSIKSSAINMELWGKHGFDNVIDYHIQLLLSEILSKKPRANKDFDEELSLVENDPENRRSVFIVMSGPIDNPTIKYDKKGAKEKIKQDIKQEKQTLKNILKEEFGLFKKDSTKVKESEKANQSFKIQFGDDTKKKEKPLTPKKKEEEDDF